MTGATGKVGRHVVSQLLEMGVEVRALARRPDVTGLPSPVEVVQGDLADPNTLEPALRDVQAVFLLWPFFGVDAVPAVVRAIGGHARRLVYLSASTVRDDDGVRPRLFHTSIEREIEKSGLEWTFLRPTGFASNTLGWAQQIRASGVVRWPYGQATRSLIHERDIAAVAARTLTEHGHAGAKYVLTGPQALTQVEQAHAIGEAIGRPIRYEEISPSEARRELLAAWGDRSFVESALTAWAAMVSTPEEVTQMVENLTGAPALTFREWAFDHANDFR